LLNEHLFVCEHLHLNAVDVFMNYLHTLMILGLATVVGCKHSDNSIVKQSMKADKTIYQFSPTSIEGEPVDLTMYRGKVLLIVNTASACGFTPQYQELERLYKQYKDQGFEVLAFPSNDFGRQEPLTGKEIESFCSINFRTTFKVFDKVHVKGKDAIDLYQFLADKSLNGKVSVAPKWNFHKYLIGRDGQVIDYFLSFTSPTSSKIKSAIESALKVETVSNTILAK
jgi:glutathione peroxidase